MSKILNIHVESGLVSLRRGAAAAASGRRKKAALSQRQAHFYCSTPYASAIRKCLLLLSVTFIQGSFPMLPALL